MKYRVLFLGFFVLIFLSACGPSNKQQAIATIDKIEIKEFKYKQPNDLSKYLEADISYFMVQGESDLANVINNKVLYIYQGMAESIPDNPNDLIEVFMQREAFEIQEMLDETESSAALPYEFIYIAREIRNTDRLFSFEQEFYEYIGGAHGINGIIYSNYDVKTANKIHLMTLFTAKELRKLNEMGENSFRILTEMTEGQELVDAGFSFEEGFILTGNFIMAEDGLIFYYAPYEIGPYSLGDFKIIIPYSRIREAMPNSKLFNYID